MGKLDIIKKVLNSKYHDESGKLEENTREVKMSIVIQDKRTVGYALYRFDQNYKADHFAREKGLSQMCDYFLFAEENDSLFVFSIELKNSSNLNAKQQLLAGECFMQYIVNTAKRVGEAIQIEDCNFKRIKITNQKKSSTKTGELFDTDGYCCNYSGRKFDISYMLKEASV